MDLKNVISALDENFLIGNSIVIDRKDDEGIIYIYDRDSRKIYRIFIDVSVVAELQ